MNRRGAVSLVWILISIAAFIAIITMSYNTYYNFMDANNGSIDSDYLSKYSDIMAQDTLINSQISNVTDQSFLEKISLGTNIFFNSLLYGASTIWSLGRATQQTMSILRLVGDMFAENAALTVLIAFVIGAVGFYITIRIIQEIRGSIVGT